MTDTEKNKLNYERSKGVKKAWEREKELVSQGRGTREWTVKEQKELLKTGRVKGYQGHHMKSVAKHPEYAADPKNIQFLDSRKGNNEHLKAHRGDYHNESDGRYNVRTEKSRAMKDGKPRAMNSYELKDKAIEKRGYTKYASEKTSSAKKDSKWLTKKNDGKKSTQAKSTEGKKVSSEAAARYGKSAQANKGETGKTAARKSSYGQYKPSSSGQKSSSGSGQKSSSGSGQKSSGSYGKSGQSSGGRSSAGSGGRSSGSGRGKGR